MLEQLTVRAEEVRLGDQFLPVGDGRPRVVIQYHHGEDEVTLHHGRGFSTTMPRGAIVRVRRQPPRVENHDAPTIVHSTSSVTARPPAR